MESVYDFESSAFSVGQNGTSAEHGSKANRNEKSSTRQRLLSKIEKPQMDLLRSQKGKRHFRFFKALVEFLNLVDKLQSLYDRNSHKTLLYLLTLLVNRIESWNLTVLGALKANKKYFPTSKKRR